MSLSGSTVPEVVGVTVPPGIFRPPRAVVALRCGVVTVRVTVRRLSGSRLDVTAPLAADGSPGVEMAGPLWEAMTDAARAAVFTDALAAEALMGSGRKRGRIRHAALEQRAENDGVP